MLKILELYNLSFLPLNKQLQKYYIIFYWECIYHLINLENYNGDDYDSTDGEPSKKIGIDPSKREQQKAKKEPWYQ